MRSETMEIRMIMMVEKEIAPQLKQDGFVQEDQQLHLIREFNALLAFTKIILAILRTVFLSEGMALKSALKNEMMEM